MKTTEFKDVVINLAEECGIRVGSIWIHEGRGHLNTGGLPILPFFSALAERLSIPLEAIEASYVDIESRCPTCGSPTIEGTNWHVAIDASGDA
jgi:hypothetical protein